MAGGDFGSVLEGNGHGAGNGDAAAVLFACPEAGQFAYGRYYGDSFTIEIPTGSGNHRTLTDAADLIDNGLAGLFRPVDGKRPADGKRIESSSDPLWSEHPTFNEYFDGDTGEGLGATHQTGWTALVAHLLRSRLPL